MDHGGIAASTDRAALDARQSLKPTRCGSPRPRSSGSVPTAASEQVEHVPGRHPTAPVLPSATALQNGLRSKNAPEIHAARAPKESKSCAEARNCRIREV